MADAIILERRYDLGLRKFMINMFNHASPG